MERTEVIVQSIVTDPESLKHSEYLGSGYDGLGKLVHVYNVDNDQLLHYGVAGMKWGKRRAYKKAISNAVKTQDNANYHKNEAIKKGFAASKQRSKYENRVDAGRGNGRLAKRNKKLMDKFSDEARMHRSKARNADKDAQSYIEEASKIGKSQHSSGKDRAKEFLSAIANGMLYGNTSLAISEANNYSNKQRKLNAAAHQANILRNKNKTKERNAAKNKG